MANERSSIDKSDHYANQKDSGGLYVTDLEFPPLPPRYSILSTQRFSSAPFRRTRQEPLHLPVTNEIPNHNQNAGYRASELPIAEQRFANQASNYQETSRQTSPKSSETGNEEKGAHTESALDRRWFGWTWRRWAFIIGPCIAIVVMAVVLAAVFVTRSTNDGSNNNASNTAPADTGSTDPGLSPNSTIPSNSTVPSNTTSPIGAFAGTSIAAAYPGNSAGDALWVFYQNAAGNLVYIPLSTNGSWLAPLTLPTANGVLNGTAITAINYAVNGGWKINLIYQDSTGRARNLAYSSTSQGFSQGMLHNQAIMLPTEPDVVKRMSWFSEDLNYHYIYCPGQDGLMHEYQYANAANKWSEVFTFPNSNGYSGCAIAYDEADSIITMHLVNSANELQMYWRNYTSSNNLSAPPTEPQWTAGAAMPQSKLGFNLNPNSTLSISQPTGHEIFAQEAGSSGNIWQIGWTGLRDEQQYTAAEQAGAAAAAVLPNTDISAQYLTSWKGQTNTTHVFVQQQSNGIAHLIQQDNGDFEFVENLPV